MAIRNRQIEIEREVIDSLKSQKEAKTNLKRIQILMKLQKEESLLALKRMSELEKTISQLESRRGLLKERVLVHQRTTRQALRDIHRSMAEQPKTFHLPEMERIEAPRRKVLSNLVDRSLKEIEAVKIDLSDADALEGRISEERQRLTYFFQEYKEQEGVLELNRQLQLDLIKKKHAERLNQLENYRNLKNAESQVEKMIGEFNARVELEKAVETERSVSKWMLQGAFAKNKGKLELPISGRVLSAFGRIFDQKTNLYIFKKGIDIENGKKQPVRAVSSGKIAYSGELPNYGQVAIIDHGDHFYTLCAHLGVLDKKTGDFVQSGDSIGTTDDAGTPIYFEIRARNIAVNPLQWISN